MNYVYCKVCQCRHEVNEVEFVNIEEDIQGQDVMTFLCHSTEDAEMQTSHVYRR